MNKVLISCDSACDLTKDLIKKHNINIIPLQILVGEENYEDDGSINLEKIYNIYKESNILPKTAAFSIQAAIDVYEKYTKEGYEIIHIDLSSNLSSCYQNAMIAASEFENVYVVDSEQLSTGLGIIVLEACRLREKGLSAREIVEYLEVFKKKINSSFVIDTLEYMSKGGRCSSLSAAGASLLQIKPYIEMRNGELKNTKKYRGTIERVYLSYIKDKLNNCEIDGTKDIFITHSGGINIDNILGIKNILCENFEENNIYISETGCTVASHCGPKTLGILFAEK